MKITRLGLLAFGPFSDRQLDLSAGRQGLHIIYGANEAGKSSALRALQQALFGIPERSADDFIHPYAKLRIGLELQGADGTPLSVVRRKGRINTLRDYDDHTVIEPAVLDRFLSGMGADLFNAMFAMDHGGLVQGGREIVRGRGDLGQLLFAAGGGIADLHQVRGDLKAEAEALFKPAAQKPSINATIAAFKKQQKALRTAQLPEQVWEQHDQALREAIAQKEVLDQELDQLRREQNHLRRVQEALPIIARRLEVGAEYGPVKEAVILPPDFGERRRALETDRRLVEAEQRLAREEIATAEQALKNQVPSESILAQGPAIEKYYQELGRYQKASADRTKLATRSATLRGEAREILADLGHEPDLERAQRLRLKKIEAIAIQNLGDEFERLATRRETVQAELAKSRSRREQLEQRQTAIEKPKDTHVLRQVLAQARQQLTLETLQRKEQDGLARRERELQRSLARLPMWQGSWAELESLALPAAETITRYERELAQLENRREQLRQQSGDNKNRLEEIERQLAAMDLAQDVPTEQDLNQARRQRERGWQLVLQAWQNGNWDDETVADYIAAAPSGNTLAKAYTEWVQRADHLADRLRREADRVASKAKCLADRQAYRQQQQELSTSLSAADQAQVEFGANWATVWAASGITPLSPQEMREAAQQLRELGQRAAAWNEDKTENDTRVATIAAVRSDLSAGLVDLNQSPVAAGETLAELVLRTENVVEQQRALREQQLRTSEEKQREEQACRDIDLRVRQTAVAAADWQERWQKAVHPLGLTPDSTPAQARAVLEDLVKLFDLLKEASILDKRVGGIDQDAAEFQRSVHTLARQIAPNLATLPAVQSVTELYARLNQARTAHSRQESLSKQRDKADRNLTESQKRSAAIHSRLKSMCDEAGCTSSGELKAAEQQSESRMQLDSELASLDHQLRKLSAGTTIDDFIADAHKIDPDGISSRLEQLEREIEELTRRRSQLDQTIGSERTQLAEMDGSGRAAEAAEGMQMTLGRLQNDLPHYVRLRLAAAVLDQAIERYREKHQGPVLKRSSELFARLTHSSFAGLRAEYDEGNQPVIVGVRPGGRDTVPVTGMSDGTADQLFLALRLASLEDYLHANEPLPFIVDDILIRFDDDRAAAALQILADLSVQTQILFFTHHQRLVELADAHVPPERLFQHGLGQGG